MLFINYALGGIFSSVTGMHRYTLMKLITLIKPTRSARRCWHFQGNSFTGQCWRQYVL